MKSFKLKNFILYIVDKAKPLIVKILPIDVLRSVKRWFVLSSIKNIEKKALIPFSKNYYPCGINLIGFIRAEIGLGQSCRLVATELEHSNYPFCIINYKQISALQSNDTSWDHKICKNPIYNINLIHINPYELSIAYIHFGSELWNSRYNIGFWLWETEEFPEDWLPSLQLVDEIWAPSEFSLIAIKKVTNKPTYVIPYCIEATVNQAFDRTYFGLPKDLFLFLCMYDSNSTMDRKNPIGAIQAYKKAFSSNPNKTGIVVKINNHTASDLEIIQHELSDFPNVYLITDTFTKTAVNSLIKCVDVFISLHRAEGFGLPIAEAMYLGKPVIATNWSSNTEFMTPECSCLVDYSFTTLANDSGPYKKGSRWAEPDIHHAAYYAKQLVEDPQYYRQISHNAQVYIKDKLSLGQATSKINQRITAIYKEHQ